MLIKTNLNCTELCECSNWENSELDGEVIDNDFEAEEMEMDYDDDEEFP